MSCPLGYICRNDGSESFPCTTIQEKARARFRIGDVYAGIYCPAGENIIKNCDEGHYCPNPSTKLKCPSKFYCPHKTHEYSIQCSACKEGSTSYEKPLWGYYIITAGLLIGLGFLVKFYRRNREKKTRDKLKDLKNRVLGADEEKKFQEKLQERLERLEPLLEAMEKKLGDDEILVTDEEGVRIFNAERLYTEIDVDKSGDLSYEELNNVLDLRPRQLFEFMSRMNLLAGASEGDLDVTKETFVHHFLEALDQASNFGPSDEEAERVFNQLIEDLNGTESQGIDITRLHETRLKSFLNETQIVKLRTKFRPLATGSESKEDMRELPSTFSSRFQLSNPSLTVLGADSMYLVSRNIYVEKDIFLQFYPTLLAEIKEEGVDEKIASSDMIDLTFQNLSLHVSVKDEQKAVVDNVTGRIHQKSMTALLGGSGAGKTSLLNALCGRAFYGEVTGDIYINGQKASIDDHKSAVGFVPQDDIVYPELTVKENFMFAGKFKQSSSTSVKEIEELAESTMASLGLTRVANSVVGNVNIRGVSGGEKKRVNIGLELMASPRILFLDEPTSGLDASSAMLVMKSLKGLVTHNAMTIVAVIHQPRKTIFHLFDSIILLGVGGKMVYHGPVGGVEDYFSDLRYYLPDGENVADWLIDISSGSIEPEVQLSDPSDQFGSFRMKKTQHRIQPIGTEMDWVTKMKLNRDNLFKKWEAYANSSEEVKRTFEPPEEYSLPPARTRSNFFYQLFTNLHRNMIVMIRQKNTKLINIIILLGITLVMSLLDGTVKLTEERHPVNNYEYDLLTSNDPETFMKTLPAAFKYAASSSKISSYAMKIGVISSVLLGLSAAKNFNDKRVEFFREAASGYDINAFFLSIHLTTLMEQFIMVSITALVALWLRNSFNTWNVFILNFIMLDWIVVAWGLLFPLFIPPENVIVVTGCFMAYCGIQFSGQLAPVKFRDMYDNKGLLIFGSFLSPVRFFVEHMAVAEQRALPPQSGFTQKDDYESQKFPIEFNSYNLIGAAQLDIDTVRRHATNGWDWPIIRAFMIGLTLRILSFGFIHMFNRQRQCKKSLVEEYKGPKGKQRVAIPFSIGFVIFIIVFSVTLHLFTS